MINLILKDTNKQVIDLDILKSHLRIANNYEDDYLKDIIKTATGILESNLELSLLYKTYNYVIAKYNIDYPITLPIRNVKSIESISDSKGNDIQFDTLNKYEITINNINNNFPINIKYIAGFTNNIEEIPSDLKLSVLQISKSIYDNSEYCIMESKYMQNVIHKYKQLSL